MLNLIFQYIYYILFIYKKHRGKEQFFFSLKTHIKLLSIFNNSEEKELVINIYNKIYVNFEFVKIKKFYLRKKNLSKLKITFEYQIFYKLILIVLVFAALFSPKKRLLNRGKKFTNVIGRQIARGLILPSLTYRFLCCLLLFVKATECQKNPRNVVRKHRDACAS